MDAQPVRQLAPSIVFIVPGLIFIAMVLVALVAMNRWLHHRETMKMLELGGDAETALRLRERWRLRSGLLYGVKLLVVGVILVVMGGASSTWFAMAMPKREIPTVGLATTPLLIFLGFILAGVGAVNLVTYAIWSRRSVLEEKLTPGNSDSGADQDTRSP